MPILRVKLGDIFIEKGDDFPYRCGGVPDLQSKNAVPSLSEQIISPDDGKDGLADVTVAPVTKELLATLDADFVASNIKDGVSLFGLLGTFSGGGGTTETWTFTMDDDTEIEKEVIVIE